MSNIEGRATIKGLGNIKHHNYKYLFHPFDAEPFELTEYIDVSKDSPRKSMLSFKASSAVNSFGYFNVKFKMDKRFFNLKKQDRVVVLYSSLEKPTGDDWHIIFNGVMNYGSLEKDSPLQPEIFHCKLISEFIKLEFKRVSFDFKAKPMSLLEYIAFLFGFSNILGCSIEIDPAVRQNSICLPAFANNMTPLTLIKTLCLTNGCFYEFHDDGAFRLISMDTLFEQLKPDSNTPTITESDILSMNIKIV